MIRKLPIRSEKKTLKMRISILKMRTAEKRVVALVPLERNINFESVIFVIYI